MAKRTCTGPECDRDDIAARGMCVMHYARWRTIQNANGGLPPQGPSPKLIDRTGLRCGLLTVIARAPSRFNSGGVRLTYWLCRCDCGNEIEVRSVELADPETVRPGKRLVKSCGCLKRKGRPLPEGRSVRNRVLGYYKRGARLRGLSWDLSDDDFDRLISQPCHYCGQPPSLKKEIRSSATRLCNGIDRVDSNLGYSPENVVPCCTPCNKAKGDMTYDEFMAWVARLLTFHFFNPDLLPSRLLRDSERAGRVT
jgi:5-methylcytosine-specific restriction endonuclease McrA